MSGRPWGYTAVRPEVWEPVARLLKEEHLSDAEVARRLGVNRRSVASVRRSLGMPVYRPEPWTLERITAVCQPLPGGHLVWRGRTAHNGTAMLNRTDTVNQVVFRLHHGRAPVGRVHGVCRRARCVAGAHLHDDLLRAAEPDRLTLRGLDVQAVRTALVCDPPYPRLTEGEARLGFLLADRSRMSGLELAERLGIAARTFERWKAKGVSPWTS